MTDIRGDLYDIAGARGHGKAVLSSTVIRPGMLRSGSITPERHEFTIVGGVLTMDGVEPGPATLHIRMGSWSQTWSISVPDSEVPISLATLLDSYQDYEPGIVSEVRANADRADRAADSAQTSATAAANSAQYVSGVVADGAAAVRAEVAADADAAEAASHAAAGSALSAADAQAESASARDAAAGSASAAAASSDAAGASASQAASSASDASDSASAAAGSATTAGQHRAAAETARAEAVAAKNQAETAAQGAAQVAATDAAAQVSATLTAQTADDRGAAEAARTGAEAARDAAAGSATAASGSATAAAGSKTAAEAAAARAEDAAANAEQGAPAGGWTKQQLELAVRESLDRADTAMQSLPSATDTARGGIRLAGDLGGTAEVPTVPRLATLDAELEAKAGLVDGKVPVSQLTAVKPAGGWSKADLSTSVQASLGDADSAVQPYVGQSFQPWIGGQSAYDALPPAERNAVGFVAVIL